MEEFLVGELDEDRLTRYAVEIGSRNTPSIEELRVDLIKGKKVLHFERKPGWARLLKQSLNRYSPESMAVQADGNSLPLPEASVSLVYARDLFGAHNVAFDRDSDYTNTSRKENIGSNLVNEMRRVLIPGGKVVVSEMATPVDKDKLISEFEMNGFKLDEEFHGMQAFKVLEDFKNTPDEDFPDLAGNDQISLIFTKNIKDAI